MVNCRRMRIKRKAVGFLIEITTYETVSRIGSTELLLHLHTYIYIGNKFQNFVRCIIDRLYVNVRVCPFSTKYQWLQCYEVTVLKGWFNVPVRTGRDGVKLPKSIPFLCESDQFLFINFLLDSRTSYWRKLLLHWTILL